MDKDMEIPVDGRVYIGAVIVAVVALILLYLFAGGIVVGSEEIEGDSADATGAADVVQRMGEVSAEDLMLTDEDVPEGLSVQDERAIRVDDIEYEDARDIFVDGYFTYWGDIMRQGEGVQQTVFLTEPDADNVEELLGVADYLAAFDWEEQDVELTSAVDTVMVWYDPENGLYFVYVNKDNRHAELVITDPSFDLHDVEELAEAAASRL